MYRKDEPKPGAGWVQMKQVTLMLCGACVKVYYGITKKPLSKYNLAEGWQDCSNCRRRLSLDEFFIDHRRGSKSGYRAECKLCMGVRPHKINAVGYLQLLQDQNGRCGICPKTPENIVKRLAVDHNHACCPDYLKSCGKCTRGLLCNTCNWILGAMQDSKEEILLHFGTGGWSQWAVAYLERWGVDTVSLN